jgi:hypothetical protein
LSRPDIYRQAIPWLRAAQADGQQRAARTVAPKPHAPGKLAAHRGLSILFAKFAKLSVSSGKLRWVCLLHIYTANKFSVKYSTLFLGFKSGTVVMIF